MQLTVINFSSTYIVSNLLWATTIIYQIHLSSTVVSEQHIIGIHTRDIRCNYYDWILACHMKNQSVNINVPPTSTGNTSPLIVGNLMEALADHPNRPLVKFFITGVSDGFQVVFGNDPKMGNVGLWY